MTQKRNSHSSVISVEDENLDMLDFDSDKDVDMDETDDYIETDLGTDNIEDIISTSKLSGVKSEDFYMMDSDSPRESAENETQKVGDTEVSFQYKIGSDSYEILQDRLQRLHRDGMEKFMDEKIFYLPDDYAKNLIQQYFGADRENMLADLQSNLRKLKFYTNL